MEEKRLSESDKIKERIKFNTELLRLYVVGLLTIGGGTVAIIDRGAFNGRENFFIAIGMFLLVFLIRPIYKSFKTINRLIK